MGLTEKGHGRANRIERAVEVDAEDAVPLLVGVFVDRAREADAGIGDEEIDRILGVNLNGVLYGTRELARTMAPRGGGRISVTASLGGLTAHHMSPIYAASKWGVVGWVRAIAPSLSERGVRVNGVCPALVDTPILGPGGGEMMRKLGLKTLTPAEVAAAHDLALRSEDTGQLFTVQVGRDVAPFTFAAVPGYQG